MNKYRIIHLTTVHTRYDTRIFLKQCCSLAKKKEYEIILFVADGLGEEKINNVRIIDLGKPKNKIKRLFFAPFKAIRELKKLNPHIIHIHDPELIFSGIFFRFLNIKVIYDVHEDYPKQVMSRYYLPFFLRKSLSIIITILDYLLLWKFSFIITATDSIKKSLINKSNKVMTINNYPIIEKMIINKKQKNSLVYVGLISEIRGIRELIQSLSNSDKISALNLIGNFSNEKLYNDVKKYDGWKKVKYYGKLERSEVKKILSKSEVGIVTFHPEPNHVESQPNKLYEYMESGLPVIISNFKKWKNIINKYKCGVVVDPLNINDISKAYDKIFDNKNLLFKMSINSRKSIENNFSWKNEEMNLFKIYKKIL